MSFSGQGHSLTLVKGHSDFKVKCLTFGLYTQVSNSGPLGPLVLFSDSAALTAKSEKNGFSTKNFIDTAARGIATSFGSLNTVDTVYTKA